jgi:hypothetical protein
MGADTVGVASDDVAMVSHPDETVERIVTAASAAPSPETVEPRRLWELADASRPGDRLVAAPLSDEGARSMIGLDRPASHDAGKGGAGATWFYRQHGSVVVVLPAASPPSPLSSRRLVVRFIGVDVHRDFCEVALVDGGRLRSVGQGVSGGLHRHHIVRGETTSKEL